MQPCKSQCCTGGPCKQPGQQRSSALIRSSTLQQPEKPRPHSCRAHQGSCEPTVNVSGNKQGSPADA